jgi:hypothetical protein
MQAEVVKGEMAGEKWAGGVDFEKIAKKMKKPLT